MNEIDEATQEVFEYLDLLRECGETNMPGAGTYIVNQFDVSREVARKLLTLWMETFAELHPGVVDEIKKQESKPESVWKVSIFSDRRRNNGWVRLTTETLVTLRRFHADAKVFDEPDGIGVDYMGYGVREGSRVSKLNILDMDQYPPLEVYNWDRGLDFDQAPEGLVDAIVDFCDALPKL